MITKYPKKAKRAPKKSLKNKESDTQVRTYNLGNPWQHRIGHLTSYLTNNGCRHAKVSREHIDKISLYYNRGMVTGDQLAAGYMFGHYHRLARKSQALGYTTSDYEREGRGSHNPLNMEPTESYLHYYGKYKHLTEVLLTPEQVNMLITVVVTNKLLRDSRVGEPYEAYQCYSGGKIGKQFINALEICVDFFKIRS